ncbi:TPA: ABC transporter ATP-binding protein [Clostridioides difficile]|nr:ABC transporter ATP-binding protein/permease [Clostridioides difficile]MDI6119517.1 ABC transporter ATP-binding protein [Clostridioides difficile]MDN9436765.1 ABC transporter ATP-binding protein/permease [Clostridioides difficile]HBH1809178.1 ABC transporter ATP-binding protein [Clostridioides difficile]HEK4895773.1 ABC transporter ATP-binding protein [Clostridioides difficile]
MKKLIHFLKPYRVLIVVVLIFTFLQTLGTLYIPTLTANIVNNGVVKGDIDYIVKTGLIMMIVAGITALSAVLVCKVSANLSSGFCRDIREAVFIKSQDLSINDFNNIGTASMITRSTSDITLIGQSVFMFIQLVLPAPIITVSGLFLAYSIDKAMTIIIVVVMFLFMLSAFLVGKKLIKLFKMMQIKMDNMNRVLREVVTGVRVIRAFNRGHFEKKRFDRTAIDYSETAISINKVFAVLMPIVMLIMNLGIVSIIWFGGMRVSNGNMEIGHIMALIEYCILILFYLIMAVMVFMYIPRAGACADRVNQILDIEPEIVDGNGRKDTVSERGHLVFKNVTFSYAQSEEPVLNNITFEAKSGEVTAIIGSTGSGKSTIANIIPRFFEIQSGEISINGQDVKKIPQKELRDKIGFMPQKAFLFSGTIEENIRYGKEDASIEEVKHAASIAQADEFISDMEDKYDSFVAQGGNNLSGGQKQRISIARALVRKPEVYVFDDSFSALDFKTDKRLRKALKNEIKDSSAIIIAQRISTIMDANQIIVLNDGKIVGIGKHKDLLENCEVYKQIADSQLSKEELA